MTFLNPFADKIYALLRIVAGFMFTLHGLGKVMGGISGEAQAPAFITWGAGLIELIGGALIMVGFLTRPAAFLASGTMAVAYFMAHMFKDGVDPNPLSNGGELAALYCWVFLMIAARGAGVWSVDGEGTD